MEDYAESRHRRNLRGPMSSGNTEIPFRSSKHCPEGDAVKLPLARWKTTRGREILTGIPAQVYTLVYTCFNPHLPTWLHLSAHLHLRPTLIYGITEFTEIYDAFPEIYRSTALSARRAAPFYVALLF